MGLSYEEISGYEVDPGIYGGKKHAFMQEFPQENKRII